MKSPFSSFLAVSALLALPVSRAASPPPGFTPLFNGKDLTGWFGHAGEDPRPLFKASPAELEKIWADSMADVQAHWRVDGDELVNDGHGLFLATRKNHRDFELHLEYKTVPKADSGIYLRGCPQVQIWDSTEKEKFSIGADKGSGGLWNNSPGAPGKDPSKKMDRPFGEWNKFEIKMIGPRVTVRLNGEPVVDAAVLENYIDRAAPVFPTGPIKLQTHGGEIRWRNVFVHEIGDAEAAAALAARDATGWTRLDNGKDLAGWKGAVDSYEVVDGAILCKQGKGGVLHTADEYANFTAQLEFKLPPGGNNGLAIRYPGTGDTAYTGMCELQVLDDNYEKATNSQIDPRQAHGSVYGMIAAKRGFQRPIGEWNFQQVTVNGSTIKVELNGYPILEGDVAKVTEFLGGTPHPGKDRTAGFFGLAGHSDAAAFKNIRIKRL